MSSDQIDPADLTRRLEPDSSEKEIVDWQQRLRSTPHEKSPASFLHSDLERIDRFEIIRVLGQGGMGRVYLAHDPELNRRVAIKVPLFDSSTDRNVLERFRREGRAAGAINHPNVVAVYEIGDVDQGCYIVCQYIEGPTLREFFKQHGGALSPRTAAQIVLAVARGVQAAHAKGIIHRDLKPTNILLERHRREKTNESSDKALICVDDQLLQPKVSDFGLAGYVDQHTALTLSGALVGTPSYMAPEQIRDAPLGPQADVFSMGVILYELTTGRSPFTADSYAATVDRVQQHDPLPLINTSPSFPRDLSAICECAINKEPQRRYLSAGQFAEDLERYLDGRPVHARSLGPVGRFQRWVRRHPAQAALASVICIALLTSLVQNRQLQNSLNRSDDLQKNLISTADELSKSNLKYRETIYVQDMIAAFKALGNHATDDVRTLLDRHAPSGTETDLRGIEWYTLNSLIESKPPREFLGHKGAVYDIAVLPDGKRFFSVGADRRRRFWDLETGNQIRVSKPEVIGRSHAIAVSPDGETFVSGGNLLMIRNIEDASPVSSEPITHHEYGIRAIAISPDQRLVASLCLQHQIHLNSIVDDSSYARTLDAVPAQHCTRMAFSPSGQSLYFTKQAVEQTDELKLPREFVVWDVLSEQESFSSPPTYYSGYFGPVDASGDGKWVAIGGFRHVQIYDPEKKRFHTKFRTTETRVLDVEFSPDSSRIAGSNQDGTLFTANMKTDLSASWSANKGYLIRPYNEAINTVAWVDNDRVLSGDDKGRILLHTVTGTQQVRDFSDSHTCQLDDSGKRLLVIDNRGSGRLMDLESNSILHQMEGLPQEKPEEICIDASGRYVAISFKERCQVWDLQRKTLQCETEHRARANKGNGQSYRIDSISISPNSQHFATTGSSDGYALVWNLETGERVTEIMLPEQALAGPVAFSPLGDWLVCAGSRGASLIDLNSGEQRLLDVTQIRAIRWISAKEFLVGGESGLLAIYNIDSGNLESVLSGQGHIAFRFAISPDRRTLVTGQKAFVHFWHVPTKRLMGRIPLVTESIGFSPDGTNLYMTAQNRHTGGRELRVISKTDRSP